MTSFIEDNNTEEAGVWVGWAFNQVEIYTIAQPCLEGSPMGVHMARWWYYGGSPRTTVGSFSLEIYLSELPRLPDLFSRPATSQMNEKKYLQSELISMPGIQPKVLVHYQQSEVIP